MDYHINHLTTNNKFCETCGSILIEGNKMWKHCEECGKGIFYQKCSNTDCCRNSGCDFKRCIPFIGTGKCSKCGFSDDWGI